VKRAAAVFAAFAPVFGGRGASGDFLFSGTTTWCCAPSGHVWVPRVTPRLRDGRTSPRPVGSRSARRRADKPRDWEKKGPGDCPAPFGCGGALARYGAFGSSAARRVSMCPRTGRRRERPWAPPDVSAMTWRRRRC
jgi:hypothetical protein